MSTSVLDDLGEEVTGILAPVSLCMALTVALVKALNPNGDSDSERVIVATAFYEEKEEDSTETKLSGSIVNALIFIVFIAVLTFVLFLLFKYGCVNCINWYMGFVLLDVFFFLTGAVVIKLMREYDLHIDAISLCFLLFNFSVVGALGLFFWTIPIVVKQGYLVVVGVVIAYVFTWIPEWSTWVLLVFMSVYDICAVLIPGGPLKALVELAVERGQDIPALVYEVRPTRGGNRGWDDRYRRRPEDSTAFVSQLPSASITATVVTSSIRNEGREDGASESDMTEPAETEETAIVPPIQGETSVAAEVGAGQDERGASSADRRRAAESSSGRARVAAPESEASDGSFVLGLPDSLKLGLGDFIFYSVLVGRAAFYDFMTVFAAYLGIVTGMGLTLLLLALYQRALPALPFSIVLGLIFYFLTRLVLEPFIVPLATALTFF